MKPRVPACSAPILWEYTDGEDESYGISGTGFLIQTDQQFLFVTAKHVVADRNLDDLRVLSDFEGHDFVSFVRSYIPNTPTDTVDNCYSDIALLQVEDGWTPAQNPTALQPISLHLVPELAVGQDVVVRGFPYGTSTEIDYDNHLIKNQALCIDAKVKSVNHSKFVHQIEFADNSASNHIVEKELNGASGSPVFVERVDDEFTCVGMLIRGGGPNRLGYVIDVKVILKVIDLSFKLQLVRAE